MPNRHSSVVIVSIMPHVRQTDAIGPAPSMPCVNLLPLVLPEPIKHELLDVGVIGMVRGHLSLALVTQTMYWGRLEHRFIKCFACCYECHYLSEAY